MRVISFRRERAHSAGEMVHIVLSAFSGQHQTEPRHRPTSVDRTLFGPDGPLACQTTSASAPSDSDPTVQSGVSRGQLKTERRETCAPKEGLSFRAT
jgi:hypothetical protein